MTADIAPVTLDPETLAKTMASVSERIATGRAELPPLPAVALEVLELARGDDVDIKKLTAVAQRDQALAGQILCGARPICLL